MRRNEEERTAIFSRRALLIGTAKTALLSTLVARMYYLQIEQSEKYQLLSDDNRINVLYEPPIRGLIYDRRKREIAVNRQVHNLYFTPEAAEDPEQIYTHLKALIALTPLEKRAAILEERQVGVYKEILLREDVSWEHMNLLEANAPDLPGVSIRNTQIRQYPMRDVLAHTIGYVGRVFPEDVEQQRDPVLLVPGFRIGRSGIEKSLETALRGNAGRTLIETNATGKRIRTLQRAQSEHGLSIDLTIDATLQNAIYQRLSKERSASAVVMEVETGAIRALVSVPSYDPNKFITGFSRDEWEILRKDDRSPFRNKALAGTYAPGSTFKMIVALAALKEGLDPRKNVVCTGNIELGNQSFNCWKSEGHGPMNLHSSLVESCDVYYYELAQQLGIDKIADMARKFGFGSKQMLAMTDERSGNVPDDAWKRSKLNEGWRTGDTLNTSIGQGFILATPLQLTAMTASLANGGYRVKPHVFMQDVPLLREKLDVPPDHLALIFDAMRDVTASYKGTAYRARIEQAGLEMGGKTGTTQVRSISAREREDGVTKNEELPWHLRDHALFVGFAPTFKPKFACTVVVEHGGGGGSIAAPIAKDIMLEVQIQDALEETERAERSLAS